MVMTRLRLNKRCFYVYFVLSALFYYFPILFNFPLVYSRASSHQSIQVCGFRRWWYYWKYRSRFTYWRYFWRWWSLAWCWGPNLPLVDWSNFWFAGGWQHRRGYSWRRLRRWVFYSWLRCLAISFIIILFILYRVFFIFF